MYVWIEFSDSVFSVSHRAYGNLFPQRLYPQDQRDDPPSGRDRGEHTQIKQPLQVARSQEVRFFAARVLSRARWSRASLFSKSSTLSEPDRV
jgi:hypothetical protein